MKKILFILLCTPILLFSQQTYVPDDNFEQALIDLGYDNVLDDSVFTSNIDVVTNLNDQETLIKYSDFNKNSDFDITGYYGAESYCFSNTNGLEPNYLLIIDSLIIKHINWEIEVLSVLDKELSNTKKEWVKESYSPLDSRHNLEVLDISEFSNMVNKNIKSDILNLEKSSKLSDLIELDV
ncbi:hypothetical protein N9B89_04605, partial [Flavobacteriales bacterium]|nr:hypothetical protein [Flavobacteriales bacterium]